MVNIFLVVLLISGIVQPVNQPEQLSSISFTVMHRAEWFGQVYERPLAGAQVWVVDFTDWDGNPAYEGITYHLLTDAGGHATIKFPEGSFILWSVDPPEGYVDYTKCTSQGINASSFLSTFGEMVAETIWFIGNCDVKGVY